MNKFISEKELDEFKAAKQAEWEKYRRDDQPLERPEEEYDSRSLYDRLAEQKAAKQEAWDEEHAFKNQIRGVDADELEFLEAHEKQKRTDEHERRKAEATQLRAYRKELALRGLKPDVTEAESRPTAADVLGQPAQAKARPSLPGVVQAKRKSQSELLKGAIRKRKQSDSQDKGKVEKRARPNKPVAAAAASAAAPKAQAVSAIAGLAAYGSDDDSDSD